MLSMYLTVAAFAKTHQIAWIIRAAFRKRFDVMDFLDRCHDTFAITFLAVRMRFDVNAADPPPLLAVAFSRCRIASVAFVVLIHLFHVLLAE